MTLEEEMQTALQALAIEGDPPVRAITGDEPIARLEAELGFALDPVTRAYLHFVAEEPSGQSAPFGWAEWDYWTALTFREMQYQRSVTLGLVEDDGIVPDPGVRARWFHDRWLPIAANGGGDLVCVDCDPAPGGTVGQIVEFRHEDSDRPKRATNVLEFLSHVAIERSAPPKKPDAPILPLLTARFFVDGEPQPAKVTIYAEPNPTPIAVGDAPLTARLPRGVYSVRFEHEGRVHWRREVRVWKETDELQFHW